MTDCIAFEHYGMTYIDCVHSIIDELKVLMDTASSDQKSLDILHACEQDVNKTVGSVVRLQ